MRWMAIEGTPEFFAITKRIHNRLHGEPGDDGELGPREREIYDAVTLANAEQLAVTVRPDDVVILHDPQTAGLVSRLKRRGAIVVWRSHVGAEEPSELVHEAWDFLAPCVQEADACVFSRHAYMPDWAVTVRTMVIQPSIDAFSPKNQDIDDQTVRAILGHVGLLGAGVPQDVTPRFTRYDGSPGRVDRLCEVLSTGPAAACRRTARDAGLALGQAQGPRRRDARLRRAHAGRHGRAPRAGGPERELGRRRPRGRRGAGRGRGGVARAATPSGQEFT